MTKAKNTLAFAPFKQVVQVQLWDGFVEDMETYLAAGDDIEHEFLMLTLHGYSVTLEPSPEGGWVTKVRQLLRTSPNAGLQFYSNAPEPIEAMAIAVVKERFLGRESDWTSKVSSTRSQKWR